jgi:hypothetical protein
MSDLPELPLIQSAPIAVERGAGIDQVETLVGQLITATGGVIASFGILTSAQAVAIAGLLTVTVNIGWRLYRATQRHRLIVVLADAAPDQVAFVYRKRRKTDPR